MTKQQELTSALQTLKITDEDREKSAKVEDRRLAFLKKFPLESLDTSLTPETYCFKKGDKTTFSYWLAHGTNKVALLDVHGRYERFGIYNNKMSPQFSKYQREHPDQSWSENLQEVIIEPLVAFIKTKGTDKRIVSYLTSGILLQTLLLYYPNEFVSFNKEDWIDTSCKAFGLPENVSFVEKSHAVKSFVDKQAEEIFGDHSLVAVNAVARTIVKVLNLSVDNTDSVLTDNPEDDEVVDWVEPCFWKISMAGLTEKQRKLCEERCVIAIRSKLDEKKKFQGQLFEYSLRKGDFVCLCYDREVCKLVQIDDEPVEGIRGLKLRHYRVIKDELLPDQNPTYSDEYRKVWTPNGATIFARVAFAEYPDFDEKILKPYFGTSVECLKKNNDLPVPAKYWWLQADPDVWDLRTMKVGVEESYFVFDQKTGEPRFNPKAFIECREEDKIIGYVSGDKLACSLLHFTSIPYFDMAVLKQTDKVSFRMDETLPSPIGLAVLRERKVWNGGNGSLLPIQPKQYKDFLKLAKEKNPKIEVGVVRKEGSMELSEEEKTIRDLLEANLNVILTGAPGTGKTYAAKRIASAMTGDTNATSEEESHIASVQFHPGYDYSDFVIGMKPVLVDKDGKEVEQTETDGSNGNLQVSFRWKDGIFKDFADKAKKAYDAAVQDGKQPPKFVFLIDEINRADLSRVFGELFSLLEEEYRYSNDKGNVKNAKGIKLPNGKNFVIPKNVYILGTMNDIDRSVESMDFALRRRFAWREVKATETMDAILYAKENGKPKIDPGSVSKLKVAMEELNKRISGTQDLECSSKGGQENSKESINIGAFLGPAYELGAAIFAKFAKCSGDFNMLWENHIKIILAEYLRGRRNPETFLDALRDVYDKAVKDEEASR